MNEEKKYTFEEAYDRLEAILETMNEDQVSLEKALHLYEEADHLITTCQKRLSEAEQKIEILLKNRDGSLILTEDGSPATAPFTPQKFSSIHE